MNKINADKILISSLKRGNEKAFVLLYEKYWEKLYFVAYQHTQSVQESEDLIHEVFIDLWKNRKKLQIKKGVSTYIFTALKYKIFRMYDARAVRRKYAKKIQKEGKIPLNTTERTMSFNELSHLIEQEINKLPERCRIVFQMRRLENFSIEEIADKLEISPNTVQNQITKASKTLKVNLKEYLNSLTFIFM